jgi:hypothetical protein
VPVLVEPSARAHRVLVGPCGSRDEASRIQAVLAEEGITGFLRVGADAIGAR